MGSLRPEGCPACAPISPCPTRERRYDRLRLSAAAQNGGLRSAANTPVSSLPTRPPSTPPQSRFFISTTPNDTGAACASHRGYSRGKLFLRGLVTFFGTEQLAQNRTSCRLRPCAALLLLPIPAPLASRLHVPMKVHEGHPAADADVLLTRRAIRRRPFCIEVNDRELDARRAAERMMARQPRWAEALLSLPQCARSRPSG